MLRKNKKNTDLQRLTQTLVIFADMKKAEIEHALVDHVFTQVRKSKRCRYFEPLYENLTIGLTKYSMRFSAIYLPTELKIDIELMKNEDDDLFKSVINFRNQSVTIAEMKSITAFTDYLENKMPKEKLIGYFAQLYPYRFRRGAK